VKHQVKMGLRTWSISLSASIIATYAQHPVPNQQKNILACVLPLQPQWQSEDNKFDKAAVKMWDMPDRTPLQEHIRRN